MSYRLGQTDDGTPHVTGSKPGMPGHESSSSDSSEPSRKGGTDSSDMRWTGIEAGAPWRPSWDRGGTTAPADLLAPPPMAPESNVPWGMIVGGVATVVVVGIVVGVVTMKPPPRRAPVANRRRRGRRRRPRRR